MNSNKTFIKNRRDLQVCIVAEIPEDSKGLVFIMHGLGGFKDQAHIQTAKKVFQEFNFTTVVFDTTSGSKSRNESDGKFEDATMVGYYNDLEDVIAWAENQEWYQEPFAISGHSLGGYSALSFAEKYSEKVSFLIPLAPVVSGELSWKTHEEFDKDFDSWKESGWKEIVSKTVSGEIRRLPWSHMEERMNHDLFPLAEKLTMPILMIGAEKDTSCPPKYIQVLFDTIPSQDKEFKIIPHAPHTWRKKEELDQLAEIMREWLKDHV